MAIVACALERKEQPARLQDSGVGGNGGEDLLGATLQQGALDRSDYVQGRDLHLRLHAVQVSLGAFARGASLCATPPNPEPETLPSAAVFAI
jgi:hypothetical protein